MIRVLLVDDQALLRAGLRVLLDGEEGMSVVGEAEDGREAVALARELRPDVVLMDICMPGLNGVEATRLIVEDEAMAAVKVLILTTYETDEHIFEALRNGASGFLHKDTDPIDLLRAVRVIADGEGLLSPSATRRLVGEFAARWDGPRATPAQLEWLTDREREVMSLVAAGLSNEQIAERLVVSPATAKTHVSRAMRKLHAHDRAQLVVLAYETGHVLPGHALAALADNGEGR